jgi:uncharacterized membrane protein
MTEQHEKRTNPTSNLSTFRIETLEDGVFAIAMTIMIFDLKIPNASELTLAKNLWNMMPNFTGFFGSFFLLGVYWFGHRAAFHYIKFADHNYHWLNILLIAFVALVPFSTALFAKFYLDEIAIIVYGSNLIMIGLIMYVQWLYATRNHRLIDKELPLNVIRFAKIRSIFPPIMYSIALLMGMINFKISMVIFTVVPLLYILPFFQPIWRRLAKERPKNK